jgi:predicted SAM-dependent methyltransferase
MRSLLRWCIEAVTQVLCYMKRDVQVTPRALNQDGLVKVNLGCGLAVAKGWTNVDASLNALVASWPSVFHRLLYRFSGANRYYSLSDYCALLQNHVFVHRDLSACLPFPDHSVDFLYCSHFLEHLSRPDALRLLKESNRVLKPAGMLRICVPDLAYAVALYAQGESKKMLANYFFVEDLESSMARHRYMYDYPLLEAALRESGFASVARCGYRQGATPDLGTLDNRPQETLFVEARKLPFPA